MSQDSQTKTIKSSIQDSTSSRDEEENRGLHVVKEEREESEINFIREMRSGDKRRAQSDSDMPNNQMH